MIRVMLADDHIMFREGVRQFFDSEDGMEVVAEANTGREAVDACLEHEPDILLLDLGMPDMDGLEVIKRLKKAECATRIVVLTMYANEEYAVRALQLGAVGYVVKFTSSSVLPQAIRQVMDGGIYIPDQMKDSITRKLLGHGSDAASKLTDRELQVFAAIARGQSAAEIAEALFISQRTVETHKSRIMQKLQLKNVVELVKTAMREGIVDKY